MQEIGRFGWISKFSWQRLGPFSHATARIDPSTV
jgi:hypothetical protein